MQKKITKKFFLVEVDIYHIDFYVSVGQTDEEFARSLKSTGIKGVDETHVKLYPGSAKMIPDIEGHPFCIRLESKPKDPYTHGSLNHELMHVVLRILHRCSIPLTHDTEEAYCYLMGFLTREIHKNL